MWAQFVMPIRSARVAVAAVGFAFAAFAVTPALPSAEAPRSVAALVGDAACRSDADCATLPLAAQGCGGPQGWLAYSVRRTDRSALALALGRTATTPGPAAGASTCGIVPNPGAFCSPSKPAREAPLATALGGHCRLRPADGASGPTL